VQNKLNEQIVFLTGASSGIGKAIAEYCLNRGARVALLARRLERLEDLASKFGERALAIRCDVTKNEDLYQAADLVRKTWKGIDIVIANAGFGVSGRMETLELSDYRRQFETNVFGVLRTVYATLEDLKQTQGRLAVIGSVNGHVPLPGTSAYSMSKFAVRALCETLQYELKKENVSVTHIAPGHIHSEIYHVDNKGILNSEPTISVPKWMLAPTDKAARQIVKAILKRKKEQVITAHGKLALFAKRFLPWLTSFVISSGLVTEEHEARLFSAREPGRKNQGLPPSGREKPNSIQTRSRRESSTKRATEQS